MRRLILCLVLAAFVSGLALEAAPSPWRTARPVQPIKKTKKQRRQHRRHFRRRIRRPRRRATSAQIFHRIDPYSGAAAGAA